MGPKKFTNYSLFPWSFIGSFNKLSLVPGNNLNYVGFYVRPNHSIFVKL